MNAGNKTRKRERERKHSHRALRLQGRPGRRERPGAPLVSPPRRAVERGLPYLQRDTRHGYAYLTSAVVLNCSNAVTAEEKRGMGSAQCMNVCGIFARRLQRTRPPQRGQARPRSPRGPTAPPRGAAWHRRRRRGRRRPRGFQWHWQSQRRSGRRAARAERVRRGGSRGRRRGPRRRARRPGRRRWGAGPRRRRRRLRGPRRVAAVGVWRGTQGEVISRASTAAADDIETVRKGGAQGKRGGWSAPFLLQ